MKNIFHKIALLLIATLLLSHCGGMTGANGNSSKSSGGDDTLTSPKSGITGGTETGTTETGTAGLKVNSKNLSEKIQAAAGALVPNIKSSGILNSSVSKSLSKLNYGSKSDWSKYLEKDRINILIDIFGDPDEWPQVVTKLRVLMRGVANTVEQIFGYDSSNTCHGGKKLEDSSQVTIPFFGKIDNGTVKDRAFDCFTTQGSSDIVYGIDASGVGRIAIMSDITDKNTESVATRGSKKQIQQIAFVTFGEKTESRTTVVYIDIQYAQFTQYSGADNIYGTGDEVDFKSRSRITGRVGLDDDWKPVFATGDFRVTKFDRGINTDKSRWASGTKYGGRGSFDDDAYFLFTIDSNMNPLVNLQHDFCIQADETGKTLPDQVGDKFCKDLEKKFAWGDTKLPFDLNPDLNKIYENNELYERNDTDLIADDRGNFVIPVYKTTK